MIASADAPMICSHPALPGRTCRRSSARRAPPSWSAIPTRRSRCTCTRIRAGKFVEYHEVLFLNQPEESVDGYTDAYLLKLAGQVEGLRSTAFDAAVKSMKYRAFVADAQAAYERAGGTAEPEGPGTPTAVINDKRIPLESNGILLDGTAFAGLLDQIHARPWEWEATVL
ncbi:DsbA family protein [Streptomyces sp. NPDC085932]|uniref:DsbA family protein n=1 Tax=Streptomyces sp. NPDC085932 TaxID=3365741 RepID=UPI0037D6D3CC